MKLFQKLLLAPAALGLFAPIAASANEANFGDVTSYSQNQVEVSLDTFKPLSNKNPLLAGGEGIEGVSQSQSDFDVDTFSSTTTAAFTSIFALGQRDGTTEDKLGMNYDWEIALSTGFTGNDSLDVVLNAGKSSLLTELDMTDTSSIVKLDTITYTTTLGEKVTAFFGSGDGTVGSSLYNTACVYGAHTDTFSDCGVSAANVDEGFGTALGASIDFANGFSAAVAYEGQGMTNNGLLTNQGADAYGAQLSYIGGAYGVSVSFANIENHTDAGFHAWNAGATQSTALNAYFAPDLDSFPSISAGIESNHNDYVSGTQTDHTSHYFLGLQWDEFGNGTFGGAVGSKEPYAENNDSETMYEVFYSYNYADGITITPLLYVKDNTGAVEDETGVILKTEFSF